MATLALAVAGAAVGSALLPAGVTVLGATFTGAMIGGQIGALAGSYVDQALLGGSGQSRARGGPRLDDLRVTASTEGAAVPRLMGRARLGGQVIWASSFDEEVIKNRSGGKGGSGGSSSTRSYRYYANFAVALCEGTITSIGRVWADGKELDLTQLTWRLHTGGDDQAPDDLIVARLGADNAPAYRGIAYIVFERLLLEPYGNRLPQLSFEVFRNVDPFEQSVRAVVMIPGSGEFVYATTPVTRRVGPGQSETENAHTLQGDTDWSVSLDQLATTLPNIGAVSLVVSWFGTDLRAGHCAIRPAVDNDDKSTAPISWRVAGLTRSTAPLISRHEGRAAYGGTPSDQTVIAAIRDLKSRGHKVTHNPFILMDVPELAYFFDSIESEGRIAFRHRGIDSPAITLTPDAAAELRVGANLIALTRAQETDLPASARISYASSERDYRRAVAEARRLVGASGRVSFAELAIIMEADQATQIAESWLFETWAARERAQFSLPPSRIALEPGDIVALDGPGDARLFRVTEIGDHGAREIDAIRIEPDVYAPITAAPRNADAPLTTLPGQPSTLLLDLPLLLGNESPDAGYFAAMMRPWPGAIALYSSPDMSGFALRSLATEPATMGSTLDDLPAGPPGRFDKATTLTVRVDFGALNSINDLALFSGGNAAAIEHAPGHWEIIQFRDATLIGPSTYVLTTLLRGQQGTDGTISPVLPAGARFVLLDTALTQLDLSPSEIGLPLNWRFGPSNRDLGSPSYDTLAHAFSGIAHRPYAPVHVRAKRDDAGLHIHWIRRSRIGGDSWDGAEIPLSEESERYEIDVLDGETTLRTLATTSPTALYSSADQLADFGTTPTPDSLSVRVYQISERFGRGTPAIAVL